MSITADRERCIGAGMCVFVAPQVFSQDDEGRVTILVSEPSVEHLQAVREAIDLCPSNSLQMYGS